MKIAIDVRTAAGEKAGKGWYTFHLVHNLLQQDKKNDYLLYSKDPIPGFQQFKNARVKLISGGLLTWHLKVANDCKKEEVDLFWGPSSYITPVFLPAQIRSIITVHDLVAFLFPNRHNRKATIIERLFLPWALRKSDHILTVSENTKKDLLNRFSYEASKITVIPCAASSDFHPIPRQKLDGFAHQTNLAKKFFLAVGTIEPRKNYVNLIRAFAQFSKHQPDYELIIVGKEGWKFEEVYDEIERTYLRKKIHILGYLSSSSLAKLYNLASALVFPSLYEGFGMPPLEAMQSGCPVITSNNSSLPEVVGNSAILIDPNSPEQIASAMLKISKDPELAKRLSEKGIKQSQEFSWKESAKKLLNPLISTIHTK